MNSGIGVCASRVNVGLCKQIRENHDMKRERGHDGCVYSKF